MDIPEEVRRRVALQGPEGAAWAAGLEALVARLALAWGLEVGPVLAGGSGGLVLSVTAGARPAVLKIPAPWLDPDRRQLAVLAAAKGRAYAELLAHDAASGALLVEALGAPLSGLGWSVEDQIATLCAVLKAAWAAPPAPGLLAGDAKAAELAGFIARVWEEQGRPWPAALIDHALALCAARRAAFDLRSAVTGHGDAHGANLLQVPGTERDFKFVDPEGLLIEPAYDLGVLLRGWPDDLLAGGDPLGRGRARCAELARLTGVDAQAIWEWGSIEMTSTGLHLRELGWAEEAAKYEAVARAWAGGI